MPFKLSLWSILHPLFSQSTQYCNGTPEEFNQFHRGRGRREVPAWADWSHQLIKAQKKQRSLNLFTNCSHKFIHWLVVKNCSCYVRRRHVLLKWRIYKQETKILLDVLTCHFFCSLHCFFLLSCFCLWKYKMTKLWSKIIWLDSTWISIFWTLCSSCFHCNYNLLFY